MLHKGFYEAAQSRLRTITDRLDSIRIKTKAKGIFVTGHSFGGALALLVGWKLWDLGYPVIGIFTFGQPRVVAKNSINKLIWKKRSSDGGTFRSQVAYERYLNTADPIPQIPLENMGYGHFGGEKRITFK